MSPIRVSSLRGDLGHLNRYWSTNDAGLHYSSLPISTANLISWWKLDETSGTRYDVRGDNDLTDNNTVTYDTCKKGNAAKFDKANSEYLSAADNDDLDLTGDFSFGGWVKMLAVGHYPTIVCKAEINRYWQAFMDGNNSWGKLSVRINIGGTQYVVSSANNLSSVCTFFVATHDGSNLKLYVNDEVVRSTAASGRVSSSPDALTFGGALYSGSITNFASMLLDEFFIYSRVLSADEVASLYNNGDGVTYG